MKVYFLYFFLFAHLIEIPSSAYHAHLDIILSVRQKNLELGTEMSWELGEIQPKHY